MKCRPYVSTESEKQELSDAYSIRCVECYKQINFRFPELLIDAEDKVAVPPVSYTHLMWLKLYQKLYLPISYSKLK